MTPAELHNVYNSEQDFWWYRGMRTITRAFLDPILKPGGRALDAGCGTGYNALEMEHLYGLNVFGVDIAPLAIRYSRQRGFARSAVASITALPYPDAEFDLVSSFDVLFALKKDQHATALQ